MPLTIVYWGSLSFFILFFKGDKPIKLWLQRPQPSKAAVFFNVILGMFPLSILLLNYHLFDSMLLIILWLLFALINPWLEELYWRGVLLDAVVDRFPKWVGVLYTTSLFVLSHPLMWGVFSIASTSYHLYIYLSIMGMVWSITHFKTRTLRWVIFSHFIVDIGNITVLTFLNIYIPPNMQLLVSGITKRQNKANGPFMVPDTRRSLFRWKKRVE
ncbi:CPBP family intramembrane glutamic endopeptidase [Niallia endozanthoxylica]|uniref:CPBP family intramembrane glutamic endopeptidase n=1 Tax=Niallia endozanthoxylica TaxID=2036016 RepID=UPI00168ACC16|nr:CPBP family intramembrane glutamic endopeptidase [Niallia endozanthoxylica]